MEGKVTTGPMHRSLTKYGYIVLKTELTELQIKKIKKDLEVVPPVLEAFNFQKKPSYNLYKETAKAFYLPRFYAYEIFGTPLYHGIPAGMKINLTMKLSPLPHQLASIEKMQRIFDTAIVEGGGGVLGLPCGYGKTFVAIYNSVRMGLKTLIVVGQEFLADQWHGAILKTTDAKSVGLIQQSICDTDHPFVIAIIHSLVLKDYPPNLFDQFGIVVFDECHHLASDSFSKAMMKIRPRFTLGLSATPERRDGLSHVFYKFIGPLFHKERRNGSNVVVVKQLQFKSGAEEYQNKYMSNGVMATMEMVTALAVCKSRTDMIIETIKLLVKQDRHILVLSGRREFLYVLKAAIDQYYREAGSVAGASSTSSAISTGYYFGRNGAPKEAHRKMLEESAKCRIVFGTSNIAKEALDLPTMNTLVFATPPGSDPNVIDQSIGRILRKFHKMNPVVVDVVDCCGNFRKHASERRKYYYEQDGDYLVDSCKISIDAPDAFKQLASNLGQIPTEILQKKHSESILNDSKKTKKSVITDKCLIDI